MTQTRSVRQSFTQNPNVDTTAGRGSPHPGRGLTGRGMLLVRGLPLRAGGRQMRHGRKGCGRTDKEKLRGASRRQHKRERRGVCVYPSCARWLLAKKFGCKRVFAASSSCITQPTARYNVRLNLTDTTSQACSGQTTCCCGSAGRKGSGQSEANERG